MIEEYFGDGSEFGVNIKYIREDKKLGTAGALGLMPKNEKKPVVVVNGDILTNINFEQLLDYHQEHKAKATMCIREYDISVPYGVVEIENHNIKSINEKPVQKFFVNAGVYVLESELLDQIKENTHLDMTTFFDLQIEKGKEVSAFPLREYWLDIGKHGDYEKAEREIKKIF